MVKSNWARTRSNAADPKRVSSSDNVQIAYDICGSGDETIIFVHGWCSDRWFWNEQLREFPEDYRLVAMDLAGHGESGRNRCEWSFSSFAEDVLAVVDSLSLERFVIVGHSMGGLIALELARRLPERVKGVIGIDSIGDADSERKPGMMDRVIKAFEADFTGTMTAFLPRMFSPNSSQNLIDKVIERSVSADPIMALAIMREAQTIDEKRLLSSAAVPVRCIYASLNDMHKEKELVRNNSKYADFDAIYIEDVGHFLHLEKPEEVNHHLRKFLFEIEQSGST